MANFEMSQFNTGEVLYDLPSPYQAHPCGLLHLPRFIAKIKKHLDGELPPSYQRNFTRGFDGFLCLHLDVDPKAVIEVVKEHRDDTEALDAALMALFPDDLRAHKWNREVVQKGMSAMGQEALNRDKTTMGIADREEIRSYADIIEVDEHRYTLS